MTDMVTKKGTTLNVFLNDSNTFVLEALRDRPDTQKYLTIVNPSSTPVTFCINSTSNTLLLPSPDTLIRVYAHYGNVEVGLEAVFSKPFPNFLQGLSEFNTDQAT
ncbi:MAG: hypothetical protein LBI53_05945 [Candidatus Peribacteria bacterium]|jgi:hypothetical protein|nr:hypothetical protein [Candidatus Peribacteria bacterium]